jgi:hypothetical protein
LAWLAALGVGLLMAWAAPEAKAADATGTWKWSFAAQNGQTIESTLKLKQDGDKLTGTITGRGGNETAIKDGKVDVDEISFTVERERNGQTFVQKYNGKLSGDTIKGKIKFNAGGEDRERDWEAKKS